MGTRNLSSILFTVNDLLNKKAPFAYNSHTYNVLVLAKFLRTGFTKQDIAEMRHSESKGQIPKEKLERIRKSLVVLEKNGYARRIGKSPENDSVWEVTPKGVQEVINSRIRAHVNDSGSANKP